MFQFQTGSIKSFGRNLDNTRIVMFQFQTGSIKRLYDQKVSIAIAESFNSKLVRLKGGKRSQSLRILCLFQFQTGSIKSQGSGPVAL